MPEMGSDGEDGGFNAVVKAMNGLTSSAQDKLGMDKSSKVGENELQITYGLEAKFFVNLATNWKVVSDLTLRNIRLDLEVVMGSDSSARLSVRLSAIAIVKGMELTVEAELPNLQSNTPVPLLFRVSLQSGSPSSASNLLTNMGNVTGGSDKFQVSSMVDSNLQSHLTQRSFQGYFELLFVKPVEKPISFVTLYLSIGGDINWSPNIASVKIELVRAQFILCLTNIPKDDGASNLNLQLQLQGQVKVNSATFDALVDFSKIEGTYAFDLRVQTVHNWMLKRRNTSADDFLKAIDGPKSPNGVSSLLKLPAGDAYLDGLKDDLSKPNLDLALQVSMQKSKLKHLYFQAYADQLFSFSPDFLGGGEVTDVHVLVDLNPNVNTRAVMLRGTLELSEWTFSINFNYIKAPKLGDVIQFRALLISRNSVAPSLEQLGRIDIFNKEKNPQDNTPDGQKASIDLVKYAGENPAGGDSGLSLEDAGKGSANVHIEFELECSKKAQEPSQTSSTTLASNGNAGSQNSQPSNTSTPAPVGSTVSHIAQPSEANSSGGQVAMNEAGGSESWQIDALRLYARYNKTWDLIPNRVKFVDLGLAFHVLRPRTDKRSIKGFIYGKWELEKYTLWTYIMGESKKDDSMFWVGLNLKSSAAGDDNVASIIADPKFARDLQLPDLRENKDISAKPKDQKLASGLVVDGKLRVKFEKRKAEELNQTNNTNASNNTSNTSSTTAYNRNVVVTTSPQAEEANSKWKMKVVELQVDLQAEFKIFDEKALGNASLNLVVTNPLEKTNRSIDAKLAGVLVVGKVSIIVYASIKLQNAEVPLVDQTGNIDNDATRKTEIDAAAKLLKIPNQENGAFKDDDDNDKEDIRFVAQVRVGDTQAEPIKASDVLSSFSSSTSDNEAPDGEMLPEGFPHKPTDLTESIDFKLDLRVGRRTGANKRSLKSLTISLTSTKAWTIIDNVLVLNKATLQLLAVNPKDGSTQRRSFLLAGTLSFFQYDASVTAALLYIDGVLSLGFVVRIPLTKLVGGFTETPKLLQDHEKETKDARPEIVATISGTVKEKKFQSYSVVVTTLGTIDLTDKVFIKNVYLSLVKETAKDLKLTISGAMSIGGGQNTVEMIAIATFDKKEITVSFGLTVTPTKVLEDLVGKESLQNDTKPQLPDATGFNSWEQDAGNVNDESTRVMAGLLFQEQTEGAGRKLKELSFYFKRNKRWDVIDNKLWIKDMKLGVKYDCIEKKFSGFLDATIYFMKRKPTSSTNTKTVMENDPGQLPVKMTVNKKELYLEVEIKSSGFVDCNTTDLVYGMTGGWLDIPHYLGLPLFPYFKTTVDWDVKSVEIGLYFTEKGKSWDVSEFFSKIAKINEPQIAGTIYGKGSSGKPKASVKGTFRFLDKINIDVEFILPKGPLLVEGYDVEKLYKMAKRLWELIKNLGKLIEMAEELGALIGSIATAAEGILTYGAILVGGLLGGPIWLALKDSIISWLQDLFPDDEDKKGARRGFDKGIGGFENPDAKDPRKDPGVIGGGEPAKDDPKKPLPFNPIDPSKWTETLQIGGTGSASGTIGEVVELLVIFKPKETPETPIQVYTLVIKIGAKEFRADRKSGRLMRFAYRRPQESRGYNIQIAAKNLAGDVIVEKTLSLNTYFSRYHCISPSKSKFTFPPTTIAGLPFLGTIVLKDNNGNVIDGYDDRELLDIQLLEEDNDQISLPRLALRQNGYQLHVPPLRPEKYSFSVGVNGYDIGKLDMTQSAILDISRTVAGGPGLCSGVSGETASFEIRPRDTTGKPTFEEVTVDGKLFVGAETFSMSPVYDKSLAKVIFTYIRPSIEVYKIQLWVNNQEIPGSPFDFSSDVDFDRIDFSRTKISFETKPGSNNQTVKIVSYDSKGKQWRTSNKDFVDAMLVCTNSANPAISNTFGPIIDGSDGTYAVETHISQNTEYDATLIRRDDSNLLKSVPPQKIYYGAPLEVLYATGNGLQTGNELTLATIEVKGFSSSGEESMLLDNNLDVILVTVSKRGTVEAVPYRVNNGVITSTRPRTYYQGDDDEESRSALEYAVDIYVRILYDNLEAYGSPFHVLTLPWFQDLFPSSIDFMPLRSGVSEGTEGIRKGRLIISDNFGMMMTTSQDIRNVDLGGITPDSVIFHASATYEVTYTAKFTVTSISCIVEGDVLQDSFGQDLVRFTGGDKTAEIRTLTNSARNTVATFNSSKLQAQTDPVPASQPTVEDVWTRQVSKFSAVLFPSNMFEIEYPPIKLEVTSEGQTGEMKFFFWFKDASPTLRYSPYIFRLRYKHLPVVGDDEKAWAEVLLTVLRPVTSHPMNGRSEIPDNFPVAPPALFNNGSSINTANANELPASFNGSETLSSPTKTKDSLPKLTAPAAGRVNSAPPSVKKGGQSPAARTRALKQKRPVANIGRSISKV